MDPSTRHGTPSRPSRRSCGEEMTLGSLRPVRARVAGPDRGINPDLMKRLTLQVLGDGAEEVVPSPQARGAASDE